MGLVEDNDVLVGDDLGIQAGLRFAAGEREGERRCIIACSQLCLYGSDAEHK